MRASSTIRVAVAVVLCCGCATANLLVLDLVPDLASVAVSKNAGWRFFVNTDIQVTSVEYFDDSGDGLTRSHPVGFIEDTPQAPLIFETTVDASDPLVGIAPWREHTVVGPTLLGGHTYWIVAVTDADPNPLAPKDQNTYDPVAQATIPQILFLDG